MLRAAVLASVVASSRALTEDYVRGNADLLWNNFKQEFRKSYADKAEEQHRAGVFHSNMLDAARMEKEQPRATFGATKFADLTPEEFKQRYLTLQLAPQVAEDTPAAVLSFNASEVRKAKAASVDWRSKGAVTAVKDQAQCGGCWAFSTTGGIEGQWFLAGNPLTSLSEQELISCDKVDQGCGGGSVPMTQGSFKWLLESKQGGRLVTEDSYPYTAGTGKSGTCQSLTDKPVGATITGAKLVGKDEDQMAAFVSTSGPMSIAVDATNAWQTYKGGIITKKCKNCNLLELTCMPNHGVLVVGYSADYWIVKNSWGPSWGESGYVRLAKGDNPFGICKSPSTSII